MAGNKYLKNQNGQLTEVISTQVSTGAPSANQIVSLDNSGKLDVSLMPTGIAPEVDNVPSSENLAAGDWVNLWNNAGTLKARKADASGGYGKMAHGFVLTAVTAPATATVYRTSNLNNQRTGMTIGAEQFLSDTVPGGSTETPPTTAGYIVQRLGIAKSATEIVFEYSPPIVLA